ncbi:lachesin-like isoform X2 [Phymastichus coffea]|uniref:lachesin-like isoform X2 n=1 Tax=Phymastichus coffea TaxID=108790 RepID=UPI00273ACC80|nr:lachesin-like isoform X2 [Phymastichus coffea]
MASRDVTFGFLLSALLYSTIGHMALHEPEFLAPLENLTVIQGRNVTFTCIVNHLQSYKIAWLKSDSREILAMQTHMVAANPRMFVTHNGHNTWKLHVLGVRPEDSGTYMCQVNTEPMRSQTGHIKVVIPPDIIDLEDEDASNGRWTSMEHGDVNLRCRATGTPKPEVTWRREDGRNIVLRDAGKATTTKTYKGEQLQLWKVQRQEMGSYLCIASNGVPPSVSKRHYVNVLFKPTINTREHTVTAMVTGNVTLEYYIEASPKPLMTWYTERGIKVAMRDRYAIVESMINDYTYQISLLIRKVRHTDFGRYTCIAENSFGTTNANIQLRETDQRKSNGKTSNDLDKPRTKEARHNRGNGEYSASGGHYALIHSSTMPRDLYTRTITGFFAIGAIVLI